MFFCFFFSAVFGLAWKLLVWLAIFVCTTRDSVHCAIVCAPKQDRSQIRAIPISYLFFAVVVVVCCGWLFYLPFVLSLFHAAAAAAASFQIELCLWRCDHGWHRKKSVHMQAVQISSSPNVECVTVAVMLVGRLAARRRTLSIRQKGRQANRCGVVCGRLWILSNPSKLPKTNRDKCVFACRCCCCCLAKRTIFAIAKSNFCSASIVYLRTHTFFFLFSLLSGIALLFVSRKQKTKEFTHKFNIHTNSPRIRLNACSVFSMLIEDIIECCAECGLLFWLEHFAGARFVFDFVIFYVFFFCCFLGEMRVTVRPRRVEINATPRRISAPHSTLWYDASCMCVCVAKSATHRSPHGKHCRRWRETQGHGKHSSNFEWVPVELAQWCAAVDAECTNTSSRLCCPHLGTTQP